MSVDLRKEADRRNNALFDEPGHNAKEDIGQERWWFVRNGLVVLLPINSITDVRQFKNLHELMQANIARLELRRETEDRFLDFIEPWARKHGYQVPVGELCRREGMTVEEAWALAQACGTKQ